MTDISGGFDLDTQYPGYKDRVFHLESGFPSPSAYTAQTGSNRGLGQWSPDLEKRYGITDANRGSYQAQASALEQEAAEHYPVLQRTLGRPPTAGELYLAHQQGIAGGPALLTANPDQPAWMAIKPHYRSDVIARQAISGNIPSDNPLYRSDINQITAGDFRNLWINKFEGGKGAPLGNMVASASPPISSNAPPALSQAAGSLAPNQTSTVAAAGRLFEEPQLQPAPPLQLPVNPSRLRNVLAGKMNSSQGSLPLPPSVKERLAALMGRMQG